MSSIMTTILESGAVVLCSVIDQYVSLDIGLILALNCMNIILVVWTWMCSHTITNQCTIAQTHTEVCGACCRFPLQVPGDWQCWNGKVLYPASVH